MVLGDFLFGTQDDAAKKSQADFRFLGQQSRRQLGKAGAIDRDFFRRMFGELEGGYDAALAEASRVGGGLRQQALDRERQLEGDIRSNLAGRGLSGVVGQGSGLRRGLQADTQRRLQEIGDFMARYRGGLQTQKATALTGLLGQERAAASSIPREQLDFYLRRYLGTQYQGSPGLLQTFAQGAGQAAGSALFG